MKWYKRELQRELQRSYRLSGQLAKSCVLSEPYHYIRASCILMWLPDGLHLGRTQWCVALTLTLEWVATPQHKPLTNKTFFYVCDNKVFRCHVPIFRWFKFTLKPPNRIMNGKLRLAIWDTSFWTFWVKFGHNGPWDTSLDLFWSFWTYVTFWRFQGHLSIFKKWVLSENQSFCRSTIYRSTLNCN